MGTLKHMPSTDTQFKKGHPAPATAFKKGLIPWNIGKKHSEESLRKMSESHKRNPSRYWLGKKRGTMSEEWKRNISEANKGRMVSEEHKRKLKGGNSGSFKKGCPPPKHAFKSGENHVFWQGGKSFEPYSVDWTNTIKRAIKERDKYTCQICGEQEDLVVHHIDYDKKNSNPENLVTLCRSCHTKTNFKRDYWLSYFNKN